MKIHIEGEYNTFLKICDNNDNILYSGDVFNVIDISDDIITINLYDEQYIIKQLNEHFDIAITKNNYFLLKKNDLEKIINYSYKTLENDIISRTNPINFLELYFENNINTIELYFEDETEIKDLSILDIDDCNESSLYMYAMCDDKELKLNYNNNSKLLLDSLKIL